MRGWILWVSLMACALLVAAFAYGCGETSFGTCADNGTCTDDGGPLVDSNAAADVAADVAPRDGEPGTDGNAPKGDGATGGDGGPGTCDPTGEPKDEPCLLDPMYGVFVSMTGTSSGAGTKSSPLNSIDAAITLAVPEGGTTPKRVYVCAGTYNEAIALTTTRDKVKVFGGFSCANGVWAYTGQLSTMAPTSQGVPLTLTGLTSALFADLEIDAQSAPSSPPDGGSASGASSIAVVANGSTGVEFRRTKLVAGNGQPGANGVLVPYTAAMLPVAADLHGNAGDGDAGGAAKSYSCPGGSVTIGGKGGDSPGGSGDNGLPALGLGNGGTAVQCAAATGGIGGANASAAANASGATTPGQFVVGVWQPAEGSNGPIGGPGQGGGGGGAGTSIKPGSGGSGGAGGCGGAGGGGGGGGGASAPAVITASGLTFTSSTLISGAAGNGGAGVAGQAGQTLFGSGGFPDDNGCLGGPGGYGGAGGAGGGGAGGVSAGILYKGTAPTLDTATTSKFTQGQAGLKGSGGVPGTNDGINGPTGIQVLAQ